MRRMINLMLCLGFLMGIYRGRIALWWGSESTPSYILPVPVFILSQEDRNALAAGIRFDSMEELKQLLDEYLGSAK